MLFFSTQTQSRTVKQSKIQIFKQFFPLALDPTTLLLYSCINPYWSEKCFFRLVMRQRGTKKILSKIVNLNQESFFGVFRSARYNPTTEGCCAWRQPYSTSTQLCCGGKVVQKIRGYACCGKRVYNTNTQVDINEVI